jgi:hypothetical protein
MGHVVDLGYSLDRCHALGLSIERQRAIGTGTWQ